MGRSYRSPQDTRTRLLNKLGLFQQDSSSSNSALRSIRSVSHGKSATPTTTISFPVSSSSSSSSSSSCSVLKSVVSFEAKLKQDEDQTFNHSHNNYNHHYEDDNAQTPPPPPPPPPPSPPSSPQEHSSCCSLSSSCTTATTSSSSSTNNSTTSSPMGSCTTKKGHHHRRTSSSVQFNETVSVIAIPSHSQYSNRIRKHLWNSAMEIREMAERNIQEFEAEGWDWRNVVLDDEMYIDSANGQLIHPCHLGISPSSHDNTRLSSSLPKETTMSHHRYTSLTTSTTTTTKEEQEEDDDDFHFLPLRRQQSV